MVGPYADIYKLLNSQSLFGISQGSFGNSQVETCWGWGVSHSLLPIFLDFSYFVANLSCCDFLEVVHKRLFLDLF